MDDARSRPAQVLTLADHLRTLGAPAAVFRPDPFRLAVGALLGVAAGAVGVLFSWLGVVRDTSRMAHPGLERWGTAAVGGLVALGAVAWLAWLGATRRVRVLVCPGGLIQVRGSAANAFPWEEIVSFHERTTRFKLVKGPAPLVPKASSKVYWVNRCDGASLRFDADTLRYAERLRQLIRAEAVRRAIPLTEDTIVI